MLNQALTLAKVALNVDDITREKNNTRKKFLNQIIKIIKTFVVAATKANVSSKEAEVIHLLRKHSSVRENVPENEEKNPKEEGSKKDESKAPFSSSETGDSKGAVYGP